MVSVKTAQITGVVCFVLVIIFAVIYAVFMYFAYANDIWPFDDYVPKQPTAPYFFPLGTVTFLSGESVNARNELINASLANWSPGTGTTGSNSVS